MPKPPLVFSGEIPDGHSIGPYRIDHLLRLTSWHGRIVQPLNDKERLCDLRCILQGRDRPNPLGLHRVTVRKIAGNRLRIGPIEAIDGTPVVDIKPVLAGMADF